ncbi:hypothetical protein [Paracoccus sp. SCSIO 75233]|uniref:hypothetical protein n=1 Tax=Paracoccus sp. SCSIO 75233 TaxID=3017782 RepID=UPI0022F060EF|nr:hypothetical protein [Paracoccus sp. SCSIO 75233]WBU54125.1 hypothetical protein PAF12_04635 [Paracoccus sp. SCSIO 75233]
MADKARLTGGIVPRIAASWRRPGQVVRSLSPMSDPSQLAVLMGAMLIFLLAQSPGHARAAWLDPSVPLGGRIAGAVMALFFIMPLVAYAVAWVVAGLSRLTPSRISQSDSRLALFWALLAVGPAMLLSGLVEGMVGPGAALSATRLLAGLGFIFIWGAGLRALSTRR